ncbi:MAG: CBS domain-containing protein [Candidatus Bilamarchaeaceae archaeon]
MKRTKALILESDAPLSKAMSGIMDTSLPAIVTEGGEYAGLIDDRHVRLNVSDPSKVKCCNVMEKAPSLTEEATLDEAIGVFLSAATYKGIPVLDGRGKPDGLVTRTDVLQSIIEDGALPEAKLSEVMKSPVYSIDVNETLGSAKKMMKEKDVHRLLVTENGFPYGVISTLDLSSATLQPKERQRKDIISSKENFDEQKIRAMVRDITATIEPEKSLREASEKMVKNNVSYVIVVSNRKPVGVLSAMDIFKMVGESMSRKPGPSIAGLSKDDMIHYDDIVKSVESSMSRFEKSFAVSVPSLHFKKGKSVYSVSMHFSADGKPQVVQAEEHTISECMQTLSTELRGMFEKMKSFKSEARKRG